MPTVQETFAAMGGRFRPDKASGTSATIQYDVSGEGGGTWNAVVKDGACMVSPGPATNPNLTLSIGAQDWLAMLWHIAFGVEADVESLISPSHLVLAVGSTLMLTGPLRAA